MFKNILLFSILLLCSTDLFGYSGYVSYSKEMEIKYNLPENLLESICYNESRWLNVRGKHGEYGVCQVKESTVRMICPECEYNIENIAYGTRSDNVKLIQRYLKAKELYKGQIDGIFGPKTLKSVRTFQSENGLRIDGIIGPRTWKTLFGFDMFHGHLSKQLSDPYMNIEYAAMYLLWLQDYLGTNDVSILSAAYNGGPGHPVVRYMIRVKETRDILNNERL